MNKEKNCQQRVKKQWKSRREDFKILIKAYQNGEPDKELGELNDYGLCLDFIEPGTFEHQRAGYLRYQLSTGGPGDEIRVYQNGDMEYWFLDWFDGACVDITSNKVAQDLLKILLEWDTPGSRGFKITTLAF